MLNWTLAMQEAEIPEAEETLSPEQESLYAAAESSSELLDAVSSGDWQEAISQSDALVSAVMPLVINLGIGILIILVTLFLAGRAKSIAIAATRRAEVDATLGSFFGQVAKWAVLAIGVIAAIGKMGVPTASFAAVIGGASLAIGLAFQGSLGNLAAGVMLLIFRPFKVGDVVNAAGVTAKVIEIQLFSTMFDTVDNRRIIVPNGAIFGGTIENITHHPTRRCDVAVGTSYDADLGETRKILERVASEVVGGKSDPEPQIYLTELGGSSIDWAIRVWVDAADYWAVRERLLRDAKNALDQADIGIPYPQMDVHLDGVMVQEDN